MPVSSEAATKFLANRGATSNPRWRGSDIGYANAMQAFAPKPKPRSLFGQIAGTLVGLPAGLFHLGKQVAMATPTLAGSIIRSGRDIASGKVGKGLYRLGDTATLGAFTEGARSNGFEGSAPLLAELGSSFHRTGTNLAHPTRYYRAAKHGEIFPMLLEDVGNIAIFGAAAAKAAGAAGTAGAAGGAATAGRGLAGALEKAGQIGAAERVGQFGARASRVGKLFGEAANVPISAPRSVLRGIRFGVEDPAMLAAKAGVPYRATVGSALRQAASHLPSIEGVAKRVAPNFVKAHPMLLTREGSTLLNLGQRVGDRLGGVALRRSVRSAQRAAESPPEFVLDPTTGAATRLADFGGAALSDAEQIAATSIRTGQADALRAISDAGEAAHPGLGASIPLLRDVIVRKQLQGHHLTPEAATLVDDYLAGRLDPVAKARIDYAISAADEIIRPQQEARLAGRGSSKLDEENVISAPLPMSNDTTLSRLYARGLIDDAEHKALRKMTVVDRRAWLDANRDRFRGATDVDLFPAPWRPIMVEAQRVQGLLDEAGVDSSWVPVDPVALGERGVLPKYSPGGEFRFSPDAKLSRKVAPGDESLPGHLRTRSQNELEGTSVKPMTLRGIGGMIGYELKQLELNHAYDQAIRSGARLENQYGAHGASAPTGLLSLDELNALHDIADTHAKGIPGPQLAPQSAQAIYAYEYKRAYNEALQKTMREKGFEAFPVKGDITAPIQWEDIGPDTPWLRDGLREALAPYMIPKQPPAALHTLRIANQKWKGVVLPLSVRWQIGDAVSNALMAWTAGGISPIEMIQRMRQVKKLMKTEAGRQLLDFVPNERGLWFEDRNWLHPGGEARKTPRTPIGKGQQLAYKLNEWSNRWERDAVFIARLERELAAIGEAPKQGMIGNTLGRGDTVVSRVDELGRTGATTNPHLHRAIEQAVERTNTILGDMANMTPFERNIVREIFPFWSWTRHLYQLAARLAVDNPARMVMILRLGTLVANDPNIPEFMQDQGAFKGPGGFWATNFLNPLADVGAGLPGFNPEATLRATSPLLKIGAAGALGQDWNRSGLPLQQPPGRGRIDEFGKAFTNPTFIDALHGDITPLTYSLIKQLPQLKNTLEALPQGHRIPGTRIPTGNVVKYATGDPITGFGGRPFLTGTPRLTSLLRNFGVPTPEGQKKVAQMQATIVRRQRARAKAARRGSR